MKKIVFILTLVLLTGVCTFYACKKNQNSHDLSQKNLKGKFPQACNFITLSGDITTTTTLSATNVYKLNGCVTVKSGVTLNIPAGTKLEGIKSATKAFLIVERGGVLNISGTSTNPVIFTSDQAPGSRVPGDWGGLRLFGNANNNNSNSLSFDLGCATYTGGGTNNADNSGTMEYFQIHFAGAPANANDISKAGIVFNSIGTGTTIDNVQVTNSLNDGIASYGGSVKETNMISYNQARFDFPISYGYTGKMQFLAAMRLDNAASPAVSVYALEITNQFLGLSTNTPLTRPVISNVTVLGPNYCIGTTVSTNFKDAVHFALDGGGEIYNSVFSSWNSGASSGLFVDGPNSVARTASNTLEFSYNSFDNSGGTPYNSTTWTSGCETTMSDWIQGLGSLTCDETGNEFSVTTLGYDGTFCSNYCANGFSQNFTLGTTTLSSPDYSWDSGSAFSHVGYRGSFGSTDISQSWTDWCPLNTSYCI